MGKRKGIFIIILVMVILLITGYVLGRKGIFEKTSSEEIDLEENNNVVAVEENDQYTKEELYEYGDKIKNMELAPNTIVAKIDGEEILKCEVDRAEYSIQYAISNGTDLSENNALYDVLELKLANQLVDKDSIAAEYEVDVKNFIEMSQEELNEFYEMYNIEEDEKWLSDYELKNFFIRNMIEFRAESELSDSIWEEAKNNKANIKNEEYLKLLEIVKDEEYSDADNLSKLVNLYKRELLFSKKIELCVENNQKSVVIPLDYMKEYQEKNQVVESEEVDSSEKEEYIENEIDNEEQTTVEVDDESWSYKGEFKSSNQYSSERDFYGIDVTLEYDTETDTFINPYEGMGDVECVKYYKIYNDKIQIVINKDTPIRYDFYSLQYNRPTRTEASESWSGDQDVPVQIITKGEEKIIELGFNKSYKKGELKNIQICFGAVD